MTNNLPQLAAHLVRLGFAPTYQGDPYGQGLDWLYFDCYFHEAAVRRHFDLSPETCYVAYDGRVAGQEAGFYDPRTGVSWGTTPPTAGRTASRRLPARSPRAKSTTTRASLRVAASGAGCFTQPVVYSGGCSGGGVHVAR